MGSKGQIPKELCKKYQMYKVDLASVITMTKNVTYNFQVRLCKKK